MHSLLRPSRTRSGPWQLLVTPQPNLSCRELQTCACASSPSSTLKTLPMLSGHLPSLASILAGMLGLLHLNQHSPTDISELPDTFMSHVDKHSFNVHKIVLCIVPLFTFFLTEALRLQHARCLCANTTQSCLQLHHICLSARHVVCPEHK